MSGHSKFANIKHKKEKNDAAKGKIFTIIGREIAVAVKEGGPDPANNSRLARAMWGTARSIIAAMVKGVSEGFSKVLEIKGVGWKAAVQGNKLVLNVGFSHPVEFVAPEGIKFECPTLTEVNVSGISKELVGAEAAKIRAIRKPEPYHGYGIRLSDEVIERKEGKTAGK